MFSLKILITCENYYPSVGGVQEAVKQISESLVRRGHDITIATSKHVDRKTDIINGVKIEEFKISGNAINGCVGECEKYQKYLEESDFDIIMNYAAQQWATDLMLEILDKINGIKVLVPCGYSALFLPSYHKYYENMRDWIKKYNACVYLSNNYRDINFARKYGANNSIVIPNGASEKEFLQKSQLDIRSYLKIPHSDFLILLVGSHTGLKGHNEAIKIFKSARISNSTFLIVAPIEKMGCYNSCKREELFCKYNLLLRLHHKKIIIEQLSREETLAAFKSANLFLFPSNIECSPIVLFECMASKTPFLTTNVGNTEEIINWSNSGILLPTEKKDGYSYAKIDESTRILEYIYYDKNMRKIMSESGYYNWKNYFTWDKITEGYEGLFNALLNKIPFERLKSEEPWKYWNQERKN